MWAMTNEDLAILMSVNRKNGLMLEVKLTARLLETQVLLLAPPQCRTQIDPAALRAAVTIVYTTDWGTWISLRGLFTLQASSPSYADAPSA